METKTGSESPQSVNISFYYKGFAIQVTKRDPQIDIEPILLDAKAAIEKSIGIGFLPSWNPETNKAALGVVTTPVVVPEVIPSTNNTGWIDQSTEGKMCPIHNKPMVAKDGRFGVFYSHWLGKDSSGKSLYCNGKVK